MSTMQALGSGADAAVEEICPVCQNHWAAGPEGTGWSQDHHCWKCGYRRGQNTANISAATVTYQQVQDMVARGVEQAMNSPQQKAAEALVAKLGPEGLQRLMDEQSAVLNPPPPDVTIMHPPGFWQASDGKWYPPESRPGA